MAKYTHNYVAKVAQGMAAEVYEQMARDNKFYKVWPNQKYFINKNWPNFIKEARGILASMLTMPTYSEEQKDEIMQALFLDRALPAGDTSVQKQTSSLIH